MRSTSRNAGRLGCCLLVTVLLSLNAALGQHTNGRITDDYIVRQWTTADGLPVNFISDLLQTQDGYIWLATGGGLVRFDGYTFKVYTREEITGWSTSFVECLYEDSSGGLWLTSKRGELASRSALSSRCRRGAVRWARRTH